GRSIFGMLEDVPAPLGAQQQRNRAEEGADGEEDISADEVRLIEGELLQDVRKTEEDAGGDNTRQHAGEGDLLREKHDEAAQGHHDESEELTFQIDADQRDRQEHGGEGHESAHGSQFFGGLPGLEGGVIEPSGNEIAKPSAEGDASDCKGRHVKAEGNE